MGREVRRVVILGGGSSGWMTAMYLSKMLNNKENSDLDIVLIEAEDIPTIGVGEATIPRLRSFLHISGFHEDEWVAACNATIKCGIKFVNWSGRSNVDEWIHPFGDQPRLLQGFTLFEWWMGLNVRENLSSLPMDFDLNNFLMRTNKGPRKIRDPRRFSSDAPYAYHLDSALHGLACKEKALSCGVKHVLDKVTGAVKNNVGEIDYLESEKHGKIPGDLFIDCSGFQGRLINEVMDETFESYSESLLCDRAVVIRVDHESVMENVKPYTTSTGLSSGWAWEIPLKNKTSYGYVYSSVFISDEEAEKELRGFLPVQDENLEARHIKMRVGRNKHFWVKNCIAVGLSGGFIEPLESTGLYLTQYGIENIVHLFPSQLPDSIKVSEYNHLMSEKYDSILDFIQLHYCITNREDTPFWKANKFKLKITGSLEHALDRWNSGVMVREERHLQDKRYVDTTFGYHGYLSVLNGMRYFPRNFPVALGLQDFKYPEKLIKHHQKHLLDKMDNFPSHEEFLSELCKKQDKAAAE